MSDPNQQQEAVERAKAEADRALAALYLEVPESIAADVYAKVHAYGAALVCQIDKLETENARLSNLLNTPQLHDFAQAVTLEAAHQRERWATSRDAGKTPEDWFWLLGYLGGNALRAAKAGDTPKALHHTISTAAALGNWHAALSGSDTTMRPGIDAKEHAHV